MTALLDKAATGGRGDALRRRERSVTCSSPRPPEKTMRKDLGVEVQVHEPHRPS